MRVTEVVRRRLGRPQQPGMQGPDVEADNYPDPVLLVLDDLAELLDLVAGRRGTRATAAAERAEQLREIRRQLRPQEQDPAGMDYGRGEWLRFLCWVLNEQDLIGLYAAAPSSTT